MTTLRAIPNAAPFIACVLAAGEVQDRRIARVANLNETYRTLRAEGRSQAEALDIILEMHKPAGGAA